MPAGCRDERDSANLSIVVLASGSYLKLLCLPLALCLDCSGEDPDPEASSAAPISVFTGRLETADSVVGLAVSAQGDVETYVCGGATTFATHSRWFAGSLSSSSASLETEGFRLDMTLRGETTDITLTAPDGTAHSTSAERAGAGSRSAVFESADDANCRWGVVVLDDGGVEPEVLGTWCDRIASPAETDPGEPAEIFAQVTPVLPLDFSKAFLPVLVSTPAGEQLFQVRRLSASQAAP